MSYSTTFSIHQGDKLLRNKSTEICFAATRGWPELTHIIYYPTAPWQDLSKAEAYIDMKYRDLQIWYLDLMFEFGLLIHPRQRIKSKDQDDPNPADWANDCIDTGFVVYNRLCRRQYMTELTIIRNIQETPSKLFALYELFRLYPDLTKSLKRKFAAFGVACMSSNPLKMDVFNLDVDHNNQHCLFPGTSRWGDIYGINSIKILLNEKSPSDSIHSVLLTRRLKECGGYSWQTPVIDYKLQIDWILNNVN